MIENFCNMVDKLVDKKDIRVILDLGTRDLIQSIEFSKRYPNAKIYAFDCGLEQIRLCSQKVAGFKNIKFVDKAVHERDGICYFYCIDTKRHNNCGGSSLFKASGKYNRIECLPQYGIEVFCTRLDTWAKENGIENIDLIWMDLQGAELLGLKGLGDLIFNVKAIYTEVMFQEIYTGQVLFDELEKFLDDKGFKGVALDKEEGIKGWYTNRVYFNKLYVGTMTMKKLIMD